MYTSENVKFRISVLISLMLDQNPEELKSSKSFKQNLAVIEDYIKQPHENISCFSDEFYILESAKKIVQIVKELEAGLDHGSISSISNALLNATHPAAYYDAFHLFSKNETIDEAFQSYVRDFVRALLTYAYENNNKEKDLTFYECVNRFAHTFISVDVDPSQEYLEKLEQPEKEFLSDLYQQVLNLRSSITFLNGFIEHAKLLPCSKIDMVSSQVRSSSSILSSFDQLNIERKSLPLGESRKFKFYPNLTLVNSHIKNSDGKNVSISEYLSKGAPVDGKQLIAHIEMNCSVAQKISAIIDLKVLDFCKLSDVFSNIAELIEAVPALKAVPAPLLVAFPETLNELQLLLDALIAHHDGSNGEDSYYDLMYKVTKSITAKLEFFDYEFPHFRRELISSDLNQIFRIIEPDNKLSFIRSIPNIMRFASRTFMWIELLSAEDAYKFLKEVFASKEFLKQTTAFQSIHFFYLDKLNTNDLKEAVLTLIEEFSVTELRRAFLNVNTRLSNEGQFQIFETLRLNGAEPTVEHFHSWMKSYSKLPVESRIAALQSWKPFLMEHPKIFNQYFAQLSPNVITGVTNVKPYIELATEMYDWLDESNMDSFPYNQTRCTYNFSYELDRRHLKSLALHEFKSISSDERSFDKIHKALNKLEEDEIIEVLRSARKHKLIGEEKVKRFSGVFNTNVKLLRALPACGYPWPAFPPVATLVKLAPSLTTENKLDLFKLYCDHIPSLLITFKQLFTQIFPLKNSVPEVIDLMVSNDIDGKAYLFFLETWFGSDISRGSHGDLILKATIASFLKYRNNSNTPEMQLFVKARRRKFESKEVSNMSVNTIGSEICREIFEFEAKDITDVARLQSIAKRLQASSREELKQYIGRIASTTTQIGQDHQANLTLLGKYEEDLVKLNEIFTYAKALSTTKERTNIINLARSTAKKLVEEFSGMLVKAGDPFGGITLITDARKLNVISEHLGTAWRDPLTRTDRSLKDLSDSILKTAIETQLDLRAPISPLPEYLEFDRRLERSKESLVFKIYELTIARNKVELTALLKEVPINYLYKGISAVSLLAQKGDHESVKFLVEEFQASSTRAMEGYFFGSDFVAAQKNLRQGVSIDMATFCYGVFGDFQNMYQMLGQGANAVQAIRGLATSNHPNAFHHLVQVIKKYGHEEYAIQRYVKLNKEKELKNLASIVAITPRAKMIGQAAKDELDVNFIPDETAIVALVQQGHFEEADSLVLPWTNEYQPLQKERELVKSYASIGEVKRINKMPLSQLPILRDDAILGLASNECHAEVVKLTEGFYGLQSAALGYLCAENYAKFEEYYEKLFITERIQVVKIFFAQFSQNLNARVLFALAHIDSNSIRKSVHDHVISLYTFNCSGFLVSAKRINELLKLNPGLSYAQAFDRVSSIKIAATIKAVAEAKPTSVEEKIANLKVITDVYKGIFDDIYPMRELQTISDLIKEMRLVLEPLLLSLKKDLVSEKKYGLAIEILRAAKKSDLLKLQRNNLTARKTTSAVKKLKREIADLKKLKLAEEKAAAAKLIEKSKVEVSATTISELKPALPVQVAAVEIPSETQTSTTLKVSTVLGADLSVSVAKPIAQVASSASASTNAQPAVRKTEKDYAHDFMKTGDQRALQRLIDCYFSQQNRSAEKSFAMQILMAIASMLSSTNMDKAEYKSKLAREINASPLKKFLSAATRKDDGMAQIAQRYKDQSLHLFDILLTKATKENAEMKEKINSAIKCVFSDAGLTKEDSQALLSEMQGKADARQKEYEDELLESYHNRQNKKKRQAVAL